MGKSSSQRADIVSQIEGAKGLLLAQVGPLLERFFDGRRLKQFVTFPHRTCQLGRSYQQSETEGRSGSAH